jgi:hypothetical protein
MLTIQLEELYLRSGSLLLLNSYFSGWIRNNLFNNLLFYDINKKRF